MDLNAGTDARVRGRSHLNADQHMIVSTFLRIDIPLLGFLDKYLLYTDADIFFRFALAPTTVWS
jgi:hypothetical protein